MKYNKKAHWVLQNKGGVGKSLISAILAMDYKKQTGVYPVCLDTDPSNSTFAGFKEFEAKVVNVINEGDIDQRLFDQILLQTIEDETGRDIIIDSGASSFVPLFNYLLTNEAFQVLNDSGVKCAIHTVVAGGQNTTATLSALSDMLEQMKLDFVDIYLWINPYHGDVVYNGIDFYDMAVYKRNKNRFKGIISMPKLKPATHGHDIRMMLEDSLTFDEIASTSNPRYNIMTKQRLKQADNWFTKEVSLVNIFDVVSEQHIDSKE